MITYFGLSRKNSAAAIVFCVPFNTRYRFIENMQMANQENIEQHKKILGILHIVFGALQFALIMLATLIVSSIIPIHVHDFEELMVINIVKYAVISLTVVLTTPAIIAGIGLLYKKDWALTLAFVIGIIGLLGFPIWTFIGIYSIIIFIMAQNKPKGRRAEDLVAMSKQ
jgi:hypothetical protein